MSKQTAIVVCPGRGTYNKPELGYLAKYHGNKRQILDVIDGHRQDQGQLPITELDAMDKYSMAKHTAGENASALIYGCAASDFADINTDKYDIVAVTGNSMGWYIAMAVAGALKPADGIELINTMGSMMKGGVIGGQIIYPIIDNNWQIQASRIDYLKDQMEQANQHPDAQVYLSIELGGYWVLAGNDEGLSWLEKNLEKIDDTYPMRLFNHAAFHSPLLQSISEKAFEQLPAEMVQAPDLPLIDGQGKIWQPHSTNARELHQYTLGKQVVDTYHFSKAIEVAIKEFAPDKIIITGPGTTLGGAVGQCLIEHQWFGMKSKADFTFRQTTDPALLAMAIPEQREMVV